MYPIVVAITGASGVVYGARLLEVLIGKNVPVHLVISDSGILVLRHELGVSIDPYNFRLQQLLPDCDAADAELFLHANNNFMAPIASGSCQTSGMVVCPCSGSTLSGIATGSGRNLVQRAAEVHLKEQRKLILVPRETPLSLIQIQNMESVARAGATVLPASPGFYNGIRTVAELVDFVVGRILDHLSIDHGLMRRWGDSERVLENRD